jgi:signal transduction histidine kinase
MNEWLMAGLALLGAALSLLPLLLRLRRRAAEAEALAEQVAQQDGQIARLKRRQREMLDKVSHDLRTPLASIQGYLELLLLRHGSLEPAELQNHLQTAVRHSERLSRLVDDLAELTRLESDSVQLRLESFPVAELAQDVVQRFAGSAGRAQVQLGVSGARDGALIVLAEVALVERVLGNLVENALRHTPCGGHVSIEIQAAAQAARVSVVDTGEGIDGDDLDRVFDRFETASRIGDTGTSTPGLGLAIARRIAKLHGSRLELHSKPGCGTRVSFELPLAVPARSEG